MITLKSLFHLAEDPKYFPRLRSIRLLEGWFGVEVILRGLDECGNRLPLLVCEHTLQECGMLLHLILHSGSDANKVTVGHLQQKRIVLRKNGDRRLQCRNGLKQILLFLVL